MLRRAASMRSRQTEPEQRLWLALRDRRLRGYKFRRQAVIGGRIVDFFCPAKALVVEVDGATHDAATDRRRDEWLMRERGFTVLRFTNVEVMGNLEGVLSALVQALDVTADRWPAVRKHHPPAPSSEEEGER